MCSFHLGITQYFQILNMGMVPRMGLYILCSQDPSQLVDTSFLKKDEYGLWKRRRGEICCLKGAYPSNSPSCCWSTWLNTIAYYGFHHC